VSDQRMTKKKLKQPAIKAHEAWCLSNWGLPRGTFRTRRQAISDAVDSAGEPWAKCRKYFAVTKVKVTPL
jgi:hypothetical protein